MITCISKTSDNSGVAASSYNTESLTLEVGKLYFVMVNNITYLTTGTLPTVSGAGITLTQIDTVLSPAATPERRITLFRGIATSSTPGALTIDFGGVTQHSCQWAVDEIGNVDTGGVNGANAIVQQNNNALGGGGNTSITVTLGTFSNVNNATYGTVLVAGGGQTINAGTNFTRIDTGANTDANAATEFASDNQTSVGFTWASGDPCAAIAVELKNAPIIPSPLPAHKRV